MHTNTSERVAILPQGHGVMVFEDGTHYEGEVRAAGQFSGKGTLTFSTGDRFEGSLHGSWNEGIKLTGTLHKNMPTNTNTPQRQKSKPRYTNVVRYSDTKGSRG